MNKWFSTTLKIAVIPGLLLLSRCIPAGTSSKVAEDDFLPSVRNMSYVDSYDDKVHFDDLYETAAMKFAFSGSSKEDFEKWQTVFRPELRRTLGLDKIEASLPGYIPKAVKRDSEDIGFAIRERWVLYTEPTVPLPFVLLRPKNITGKLPLVITPHGHGRNTELYAGIYHNEEERQSMIDGERDIAIQAVKQGYIAIAPTTRGFGETRTNEDRENDVKFSCRIQLMHDIMVGRTPIGDRVWDISRIIDWATANLPVDTTKIAVTGNSGGGTVTLFASACDTRITISMPSSYFCTFAGSIGTIAHCDCNYIPGILELGEMGDVAGLIAPRAFCAIHGEKDPIFPITETRKSFKHLQEIYAAAGAPDNCKLYVGPEGHRYYKAGAWPFVKKNFDSVAE